MSRKLAVAIGVFVTVMTLSAAPAMADVEAGFDAGSLPGTAQYMTGSGTLNNITGSLLANNDVDMYRICISNPGNFSASTLPTPANFVVDPQLFLFNASGYAVTGNDDFFGLQSNIPVGTIAAWPKGVYYLAVSSFNNDPLAFRPDGTLQGMFDGGPVYTPTPNRGPVQQWTDNGFAGATKKYRLTLSGVKRLSGTGACPV